MTIATVAFSFICILLILGYQFNLQKGTVEQGGLLQFRSFPSGATINLDKKTLNFKTPGKENVEVGTHTVVMSRSGYREWSKSFAIKAGELRWLNYTRFVPNNITTNNLRSFEVLTGSLPSPDRKWMLLYGAADVPVVTLVDIRDAANIKYQTLTLPSTSYTVTPGQPQSFKLKEWDFGARYALVEHRDGANLEILRIDRTDIAATRNLTAQINLPISDIHFSGTSGNVFYALAGTDIRRFDIGNGTISEPLASNVTSFKLYKENVIAYTTSKDNQNSAGVIVDNKATIVKTFDASLPISVDISEYFDHLYLAVARDTKVEIIKDPVRSAGTSPKSLATASLPEGVKWIRFSAPGRFVVAGNGNHFVTRDLETEETFTTALPGTSTDPTAPLQWLDDYYLVSDAEGSVRLSEFDGQNQNLITNVAPGFKVTLSDNGNFLYSVSASQSGFTLQSSKMTTTN